MFRNWMWGAAVVVAGGIVGAVALGTATRAQTTAGTATYSYYSPGFIAQETYSAGNPGAAYTYDAAGNRTIVTQY